MMLETTIAGSLPKPAWLAEPEKLWAAWRHEGADLERAKRDAALVWLKEQEAAGIGPAGNGPLWCLCAARHAAPDARCCRPGGRRE